jgi:glutamate-1-semialdehyde 2,1-aminomutase
VLEERLNAFLDPIRAVIAQKKLRMAVQSAGSMFTLFFGVDKVDSKEDLANMDEEKFKHFFRYLFERGVYLSPSAYEAHFLSSAHSEENLAKTQSLIIDYLCNNAV